MTDQELKDLVAGLAISHDRIDAELTRIAISQAKTDEQIKETNKLIGGIGNSNGAFAENFFYTSLAEKMQLGTIKFDEIEHNLRHKRKNIVDEFDIIMYNGDSIGLIEVKYEAKSSDIKKLYSTKVQNFKILYPEYEGYKIYLGIAGFSFQNAQVKAEAQNMGIAVLEIKGDHLEINASKLTAY